MKVGVDDQIFWRQRHGGVSRYFVELMRHLTAAADTTLVLPWRYTRNQHALDAGFGRPLPVAGDRGRVVRAANRPLRRWGDVDVMHHTHYDFGCRRPRAAAARVVTVYDMTPEVHPELFPDGNPHGDKRRFVSTADLVLCISEATRQDLLTIYGEPPGSVVVTHLGVDEAFGSRARPCPALPPDYLLFVGTRGKYKDFSVLLQAFARLATRFPDLHLLCAGGGPLTVSEQHDLRRAGLLSRVRQASFDDEALAAAYAGARCFVFPSRHEGFGLPTLEAMACGAPVVLADASSHPEVGGDAALYFTPEQAKALEDTLRRLLTDPGLAATMSARGRARARSFSWAATGAATTDAYRRVVEEGPSDTTT